MALTDTFQNSGQVAEIEINYKSKVKPSERATVKTSRDAFDILKGVWSDKIEFIEEVLVLCLNRSNKVLGWVKLSQGGTTGCIIDVKVLFQIALAANASALILAHNHPSGNSLPSQSDINITKKCVEAGKIIDIPVVDHMIITPEGYYSFADNGILN